MSDDYYVIHKKVLPDYFEKVIQIKEIINKGASISDACKEVGLSRSTFYKYKDYVNRPSIKVGRHIILSLKLVDEPGALSNILNEIASRNANILAINQEVPIHNIAFVTLTIAVMDMDISIQSFIQELHRGKNVIDVMLIAVE
ncbi:TPA: ACT domain-containing protein [Candidatus Avacholeplasma faecigallinarum]|nr:ACT domain-containing protein [Candidatus Avacholeplasma faecigallinarum]